MQWVKTITGSLISDSGRYKIEKNVYKDVFEVFDLNNGNELLGEAFTLKSAKHIAKKKEKWNANRFIPEQREVQSRTVRKPRRMAD